MDTYGSDAGAGLRALVRAQKSHLALLVGYDRAVAKWVSDQLGSEDFGACTAIGVVRGDELIAGAVFNGHREANIEISFASSTPRWCTRGIMAGIFWYPFGQLGVHRLTAVTEDTNHSVKRFLCHLGFHQEGIMRRAYRSGDDAVIYGMLREECRWLSEDRGKIGKAIRR